MRLASLLVTEPCGSQAFSVRWSPDDAFVAAAGAQGRVCVFNATTGQEAYRLNRDESKPKPVKQVCWRPQRPDAPLRTRDTLVGASTDGKLRQWHVTSSRLLQEFGDPEETKQLLCLDYSPDASCLVAGGLSELWLFDEETKKLRSKLASGDYTNASGHTSRVQAVRFVPSGQGPSNLVVSGGWDSTVQFWDLRAGYAVRSIHGPHICGESLDVEPSGKQILIGSWRDDNPLELWDFGTGKLISSIPWRSKGSLQEPPCLLFAARFSRDPSASLIAAGGSLSGTAGNGEAKVLERPSASAGGEAASSPFRCAGSLVRFTCVSADFSYGVTGEKGISVAFGGSDGRIRTMLLLPEEEGSKEPRGREALATGAAYPGVGGRAGSGS